MARRLDLPAILLTIERWLNPTSPRLPQHVPQYSALSRSTCGLSDLARQPLLRFTNFTTWHRAILAQMVVAWQLRRRPPSWLISPERYCSRVYLQQEPTSCVGLRSCVRMHFQEHRTPPECFCAGRVATCLTDWSTGLLMIRGCGSL